MGDWKKVLGPEAFSPEAVGILHVSPPCENVSKGDSVDYGPVSANVSKNGE